MKKTKRVADLKSSVRLDHFHPTYKAVFLFVLGACFRFPRATGERLSLDELYTLYFSQLPLRVLFSRIIYEPNPPLGSILYKVWREIIGNNRFEVEALSAGIGSLTVVVLYLGYRHLLGERSAFLASLCLSLSLPHILVSNNIRIYAIACLVFLLGTA